MKKVSLVVRACGDYVNFDEMGIYIVYAFGSIGYLDIVDEIVESDAVNDKERELLLKILESENATPEENEKLDEIVERYVDGFEGDGCDYETFDGVEVDGEFFVSL